MSYSTSRTATFTVAHARNLSSKVAADMNICANYYGKPTLDQIEKYSEELTELLRYGYVETYEFGFKKDDKRVVSWYYIVDSSGSITSDDRAGKLTSGANIEGATFFNFLTYSSKWDGLSSSEREEIKKSLPIQRTTGEPPADGSGYWTSGDRSYSSGGVGMSRNSFRPL
jgi:hypothetical protein